MYPQIYDQLPGDGQKRNASSLPYKPLWFLALISTELLFTTHFLIWLIISNF